MLRDTRAALDDLGFAVFRSHGVAGDYVIERSFVDKQRWGDNRAADFHRAKGRSVAERINTKFAFFVLSSA